MDAGTGRHRKRDIGGLFAAGALIALALGFLGGFLTDRYLLDSADGEGSAATSSAAPSSGPAGGTSSSQEPPEATGSAAPADPAPVGPQGARAFLARLTDEGLPVQQHREAILVLGRVVCDAPPSEQADEEASAARVAAVAGTFLTRAEIRTLVRLAAQEFCGA